MTSATDLSIMKMVTDITVAHVSHNQVEPAQVSQLITDVYEALSKTTANGVAVQEGVQGKVSQEVEAPAAAAPTPAPAPQAEEVVPAADEEQVPAETAAPATAARAGVQSEPKAKRKVQAQEPETPKLEPAVPIEESVQPEYLVCLEDGTKKKMLKRYLRTHFKMTPEQYKEKWGLPADYPMTAPVYRQQKAEYAKIAGLGKHNRGKTSRRRANA